MSFKHLTFITFSMLLTACGTTIDNRNPTNEAFPTVVGESLNKEVISLPDGLAGQNRLLLIGYVQDAQFDIDRWLIGLDMTKNQVTAYEIPTIAGMAPRMFETFINDGMRAGIPKYLWGGVITVYKGAEKIVTLTGNDNENNARVILLDEQGQISYFYDGGFSVKALNELRDIIERQELAAQVTSEKKASQ